jgi:hypothetical protein
MQQPDLHWLPFPQWSPREPNAALASCRRLTAAIAAAPAPPTSVISTWRRLVPLTKAFTASSNRECVIAACPFLVETIGLADGWEPTQTRLGGQSQAS